MAYEINPILLDVAGWAAAPHEKRGFVPPGGGAPPMDPAMMGGAPPGGPPMDPSMMGGAPPGGPPMDPSMMGGAPPMDPAMMGGAPPMGPPPMGPPAAPPGDPAAAAAPPANGAAGGSKKIDPAFLYMEMSRVRKLLTTLFQNMDMQLPPDVLDDNSVAQVMSGQQPTSSPLGQEAQPPAAGGGPALPGIGGSAPVTPVEPPKTASIKDIFAKEAGIGVGSEIQARAANNTNNIVDALAKLSRSLNRSS